jgi:diadenosine tetraphosphate (Ap4A) HIT family hydrolase
MDDCFFCKVKANPTFSDIYDDDFYIGHLSGVPINPGHVELFVKRHIPSILELNEAEQNDLIPAIKAVMQKLLHMDFKDYYSKILSTKPESYIKLYTQKMLDLPFVGDKPVGFNVGINQGVAAGQTVMHLHIHVIPRFKGDCKDPTGGVRNFLNKLGDYKRFL